MRDGPRLKDGPLPASRQRPAGTWRTVATVDVRTGITAALDWYCPECWPAAQQRLDLPDFPHGRTEVARRTNGTERVARVTDEPATIKCFGCSPVEEAS